MLPHCVITLIPSLPLCRAKKLFEGTVRKTLDAAGVAYTLHITQRAGNAGDIAAALDLASCDALLFMGGDGTVHEALQVRKTGVSHADCGLWDDVLTSVARNCSWAATAACTGRCRYRTTCVKPLRLREVNECSRAELSRSGDRNGAADACTKRDAVSGQA